MPTFPPERRGLPPNEGVSGAIEHAADPSQPMQGQLGWAPSCPPRQPEPAPALMGLPSSTAQAAGRKEVAQGD